MRHMRIKTTVGIKKRVNRLWPVAAALLLAACQTVTREDTGRESGPEVVVEDLMPAARVQALSALSYRELSQQPPDILSAYLKKTENRDHLEQLALDRKGMPIELREQAISAIDNYILLQALLAGETNQVLLTYLEPLSLYHKTDAELFEMAEASGYSEVETSRAVAHIDDPQVLERISQAVDDDRVKLIIGFKRLVMLPEMKTELGDVAWHYASVQINGHDDVRIIVRDESRRVVGKLHYLFKRDGTNRMLPVNMLADLLRALPYDKGATICRHASHPEILEACDLMSR